MRSPTWAASDRECAPAAMTTRRACRCRPPSLPPPSITTPSGRRSSRSARAWMWRAFSSTAAAIRPIIRPGSSRKVAPVKNAAPPRRAGQVRLQLGQSVGADEVDLDPKLAALVQFGPGMREGLRRLVKIKAAPPLQDARALHPQGKVVPTLGCAVEQRRDGTGVAAGLRRTAIATGTAEARGSARAAPGGGWPGARSSTEGARAASASTSGVPTGLVA